MSEAELETVRYPTRPQKIELQQKTSRSMLAGKELHNPIEVNLVGPRAFIYTKHPLKNIEQDNAMHSEEPALRGPLSLNDREKQYYTVNLNVAFQAELEEGVKLISDGKGLLKLRANDQTETLLDASKAVSYLNSVKAYKAKSATQARDTETILKMHQDQSSEAEAA